MWHNYSHPENFAQISVLRAQKCTHVEIITEDTSRIKLCYGQKLACSCIYVWYINLHTIYA